MNKHTFTLALTAIVTISISFVSSSSLPAPAQTSGCASPIYLNVRANSIVNACTTAPGLDKIAIYLATFSKTQNLREDQIEAMLATINDILHQQYGDKLDDLSEKIDQIETGLDLLLRKSVSADDSPQGIQRKLANEGQKLLPGVSLSQCGCWGKLDDVDYGETRTNDKCLSGDETNAACQLKDGSNICPPALFDRVFGEPGYAPWERECSSPRP